MQTLKKACKCVVCGELSPNPICHFHELCFHEDVRRLFRGPEPSGKKLREIDRAFKLSQEWQHFNRHASRN